MTLKEVILEVLDDMGDFEMTDLVGAVMLHSQDLKVSYAGFKKAIDQLARAEKLQVVDNADGDKMVCLYGTLVVDG